MHTKINVIAYINMLIFQLPFIRFAPTIVEEIIDGNLDIVDIIINFVAGIGKIDPI